MIKVLVVDDEVFVRKGIVNETDWASLGCEIAGEAANGVEALKAAEQLKPDLIISDIRMPKMDGIEMLKELRARGNRTHVIFLTAYSEFEYAKQALKLFAFDYLLKPFEDGELEDAVTRACREILEAAGSVSAAAYAAGSAPDGNIPQKQPLLFKEEDVLPPRLKETGKNRYVREAFAYIAGHYQESDLTIGDIAASMGLSEGHFSHLFKKETGYTVTGYLTRYRMRAAMEFLSDCRNKVYEAAEKAGYKDITYFSSTFKRIVGMTPSEYQNRR